MKKLKIGLFIDTFYPMVDGVIQVVDQYAKRLSEFCDVTVFATKPRRKKVDKIDHPYKVIRCKALPIPGQDYDLPLPSCDKKFKQALKDSDLDIVHIHSPFGVGKYGVKYAKKNNIPVIATMHSQYKAEFYKATKMKWLSNIMTSIIMKTFNACDKCYAVNESIAKLYHEDYKAKVLPGVLSNGTDFLPVKDEKEAATIVNHKFNLDEDIPVLLFVGRITTIKNIFFIADSLKLLKDKGQKFKMFFVGSGQDEEKLKEKVIELGIEEDVIFTGKIMDREFLKAIFSRANLFLFPSYADANSLVQIEAASQKTPTVFLEGSATSASVVNDVNGFISPNSTNAFAEKIYQVLNDKELYEKVKHNAFKDLYMSWDDCVKVAYNLYINHIKEKYTKNNVDIL